MPTQNISKPTGPIKVDCPNCGAEWNNTEIKDRECLSCGYPDCWDKETDDENDD